MKPDSKTSNKMNRNKKLNMLTSLLLIILSIAGCQNASATPAPNQSASATQVPNQSPTNQPPANTSNYAGPVIYVTVFTHVEQRGSLDTPDFLRDEDAFWNKRTLTLEFARELNQRGVGYNYQADWLILEAALKYDHGTQDTNGKNYVQYMHEDLAVQIDPHNHPAQSDYNNADVAYLIDALGVQPSGILGGATAFPPDAAYYMNYWQPEHGNVYDYTWQAQVLWGGGTPGHLYQELTSASGVWKPGLPSGADDRATDYWLVHDESAPLPYIGGWREDWDSLDLLLEKLDNGELESNKIYTISIDAHSKNLTEEFIQEFLQKIDSYAAYTQAGKLQWVTYGEVIDIWQDKYASEPSIFPYLTDQAERDALYQEAIKVWNKMDTQQQNNFGGQGPQDGFRPPTPEGGFHPGG